MTCWRRLRDWHEAGVWDVLHQVLLQRLADANRLDWSRAAVDSCSVPAPKGRKNRPESVDRGRTGTKRHLVVERGGLPLATVLSAANVHGSKRLEEALDAVLPIVGPCGRPRRRVKKLHVDKGYDYAHCRAALRANSIQAHITQRGQDSSQRLGRHRWVVEPTLA